MAVRPEPRRVTVADGGMPASAPCAQGSVMHRGCVVAPESEAGNCRINIPVLSTTTLAAMVWPLSRTSSGRGPELQVDHTGEDRPEGGGGCCRLLPEATGSRGGTSRKRSGARNRRLRRAGLCWRASARNARDRPRKRSSSGRGTFSRMALRARAVSDALSHPAGPFHQHDVEGRAWPAQEVSSHQRTAGAAPDNGDGRRAESMSLPYQIISIVSIEMLLTCIYAGRAGLPLGLTGTPPVCSGLAAGWSYASGR